MKKIVMLGLVLLSAGLFAQDIKLAPPQTKGGASLREALTNRRTIRNFTGKDLTPQQLSDLFYAACGMNRKAEKKLTIPTARNVQDITVYAFTAQGRYRYDATTHTLKYLGEGDSRADLGRQKAMFSKAAVVLVYTSDFSKYNFGGSEAEKRQYAGVHAGFAMQNVALFCAAEGLGNVVIGSHDKRLISGFLGFAPDRIIMVQLVGVAE